MRINEENIEMQWWLTTGEGSEGPFPEEHIIEWLKTEQISPEVKARCDKDADWRALREIDEFTQYIPAIVPPAPPSAFVSEYRQPPNAELLVSDRRPVFDILFVAIATGGFTLLLEFFDIGAIGDESGRYILFCLCVCAVALTFWAMFHYRLWCILPSSVAEIKPNVAVGFLFIPFFNCYWVFKSYLGISRGLNRLADDHGLPGMRTNTGLAMAASILFVSTVFFDFIDFCCSPTVEDIPNLYVIYNSYDYQNAYAETVATAAGFDIFALILGSIPSFVLWILMTLNQKRMVEYLYDNNVPLNSKSKLLAD